MMYRRNTIAVTAGMLLLAGQGSWAAKVEEPSKAKPARKSSAKSEAPKRKQTPPPEQGEVRDQLEADPLPREVLAAMFAGDRARMRDLYYEAARREQTTRDNRAIRTSDAVLYLYNNSLEDREQFLAGQEIAAAETRSNELRTRILMSLLTDEVYELNRVEDQNRFNKFTRVFNRATSSLSQLVMLQPQAAMQLVWDGIHSVRQSKAATDKERKMVYLSTQFLKKHPDAPEAQEVRQLLQTLKDKLNADRAAHGKLNGKAAMKKHQYAMAEYHLEKAALLVPSDAETSQLLKQARAFRQRVEESEFIAVTVGGAEQQMNYIDASVLAQACRALACSNGSALAQLQSRPSGVMDSLAVAAAAITEANGRHDTALQQLAVIPQQAPNTPGARAAAATLSNAEYNLDEHFEQALRDLAALKRKFLWTGNRTGEESAYQVGSATIQQGAQVGTGLPLLVGADVAIRSVTEQFRTSLDVDPVVDAGARYIRKYPNSTRAKQIAAQLAEFTKKSGDYNRAGEYLTASGTAAPGQLAKLDDKKATALFEKAKNSTDLVERRDLLKKLAADYPNSKVVQKSVGAELRKIAPQLAPDSIVLTKKMLEQDPTIAQQLGFSPALVDGSRDNGELAAEGISIHPKADMVEFKLYGEETFRPAGLPTTNKEQLLARARQIQRDYSTRQQNDAVVKQQKVPFAIDGGIGSAGMDLAPQLVPAKADPRDKERFK